jgi:dienelactone hydrolase
VGVIVAGVAMGGPGFGAEPAGAVPRGAVAREPGPVGVVTRTFVDRDRRTPADSRAGIVAASSRTLPTTLYYPARRGEPGSVTDGARPAKGPFPAVVFNGGSPGEPEDYEPLIADWAAHGYVVVAPEFPVSSVAGPDDVAWQDLPAQTKDARFVLDRVLALDPAKAGIPEIDEDRIAVAGHSFGGATALSLASTCCRDRRFRATIALAAVTVTEAGPNLKRPAGPVLYVHSRGDRAVSYDEAVALCNTTGTPKRFLTVEVIRGLRAHVYPYVGDDQYSAIVRPAIIDFLDGYLLDRKAARARLDGAGAQTDVAEVTRCRERDTPPPTPTVTTVPFGAR